MNKTNNSYWKENLKYVFILLIVWFIVSFGFSILFKENLDVFSIGGFKLGFWFAQQGSMYTFVILIFIYVRLINKLDKKYGFNSKNYFIANFKWYLKSILPHSLGGFKD